jgi:transposase
MDGIVPKLRFADQQKILKQMKYCRDAPVKQHYLIIVNLIAGRPPAELAQVLQVARSTVYRVARRFRDLGEAGLLDQREDNGQTKLEESYLAILYEVVKSNPQEHGWKRPTWTREMMVETLRQKTGTRIHPGTMSRALKLIRARRGRPRPVVRCPWSKWARSRRLNAIRRLVKTLPAGQVAVYEDEVDIHLNPKIGLDWMVCGQQKEVVTPGQNVKRYIAGALDAVTGHLIWVAGEKKTSALFIQLLQKLSDYYGSRAVIHIILDNYRIHTSKITQQALAQFQGKIVLHFLPPYCPNENKIERLWQDLHANVTRNHRCETIEELMKNVRHWLRRRSHNALKKYLKNAA